jgi:uncharacterized membrane protein YagU involved in acid resistance
MKGLPAMPQPSETPNRHEDIEMPQPTAAPMILAAGIVLLGAGVILGWAMSVVGAVVFAAGLAAWVGHLLPGRGHFHEQRVAVEERPQPIAATPGAVEQLATGLPGYRMRLPLHVHPISAGVKGGLLGGLLMPLPALLWGLVSGNSIWYPINLLAGMAAPGVETADLKQFSLPFLLVGGFIHLVMSVVIGLIYGVLLPTLPELPRSLSWAGLLMPLLWTAASFILMGFVNPALQHHVSWPWFIVSQFVYGVVMAAVVTGVENLRPVPAGILGGAVGGLLMAVPAVLWSAMTDQGIWLPVNLLAGMVVHGMDTLPVEQLREFNGQWLAIATIIHAALSIGFGVAFSLLRSKLPAIPGPIASGGLLMPLLWTGASYSLMGVVNPLLQQDVDWPWFIASQFLFGIVVALVVARSETIAIPPKGMGPDTASLTR